MGYREFNVGKNFLLRAKYDSEIVASVTEFAKKNSLTTATFTALGALKSAKLGFYDQQKHEYLETLLLAPHEITSCVGNISIKSGEIFVHAHAVLADRDS